MVARETLVVVIARASFGHHLCCPLSLELIHKLYSLYVMFCVAAIRAAVLLFQHSALFLA
jgi:hypothetical protein